MSDTSDATNPRAVIGDNLPPLARSIAAERGDFAAIILAYLEEEYSQWPKTVDELLAEAKTMPEVIEDDDTKAKVVSLIKRFRETCKSLDGLHAKEKQPYLRGGQVMDQWWFALEDKCLRRTKANNPGAADVLARRLTDYDNRKLAEEQARRQREAAENARIAREAQEREREAQRQAEEARLAAERARKPETVAAKEVIAQEQERAADGAKVDAAVTTARAQEAHIATLAKPADIMRTRGADGTLSTMAQETFAELVDRDKLDKSKLWPFIAPDALEKALRAWARSTDYRVQMDGASVGRRNKSVVR